MRVASNNLVPAFPVLTFNMIQLESKKLQVSLLRKCDIGILDEFAIINTTRHKPKCLTSMKV